MRSEQEIKMEISLLTSRSRILTDVNHTGSWSYIRPSYRDKTAPCAAACPCGTDIPQVEMLAAQGRFRTAWETILMENPFPAVCGRVCFHPCETACNRGDFDSSIAVNNLERFLADTAMKDESMDNMVKRSPAGKRIAIVGAGPAGLSAACFLARLGYACDVLEAEDEPGGVLRWGIPAYRLPLDILNWEIRRIKAAGVNIFCNTPVHEGFLREARGHYDAVFVACGHGQSQNPGIPGQDLASDGLKFLAQVRKHTAAPRPGTAVVIGGGNTAVDVARSLLRFGVQPLIIYRRRQLDMPAFDHEVKRALAEGVRLMQLHAPVAIERDPQGAMIRLQKMKISDIGSDGRPQVVPASDETVSIEASDVYAAIGAQAAESWMVPAEDAARLKLSHCAVCFDEVPVVFGGDLTNAVQSVPDAVASGKQAAMALDVFFRQGKAAVAKRLQECRVGDGDSLSMEIYLEGERVKRSRHVVRFEEINTDYFCSVKRPQPLSLPPVSSIRSFDEVDRSLDACQAVQEAGRCFNCGICNGCDNCRTFCPEVAVIQDKTRRRINADYCKGCGVCVVECPRSAMVMEDAQS